MDKLCPVEYTISLINGKWKMSILKELSGDPLRYGELERCLPRISPKVLVQQLRELESDGLISRTIFAEVPPRVEYALSDKGRSLATIIAELRKWGLTESTTQCALCAKCRLR